jgi:hypothetical protein
MAREGSFPWSVVRQLAFEANFRCVRRGCYMLTHLWDRNKNRFIVLGEAAHDSAASRGGPRYRPELTVAQRSAVSNGAWLCPTCATRVDKDPDNFPLGTISSWQSEAAEFLREQFNYPFISPQYDMHEMMKRAEYFCGKFNFVLSGLSPRLSAAPHILGSQTKAIYHFVLEFERIKYPTHKSNTGYRHTTELQTRIVHNVRLIYDEVRSGKCWYRDEFQNYRLQDANRWGCETLPDEGARQSSLSRVVEAWADARLARERLLAFSIGKVDMGMIAGW